MGVAVALDPVSSYGGFTPTVRRSAASIAVDAIPAAECTPYAGPLAADQRGRAAPRGRSLRHRRLPAPVRRRRPSGRSAAPGVPDASGRPRHSRLPALRIAERCRCTVPLPCARHAAAQRAWPGIGDSLWTNVSAAVAEVAADGLHALPVARIGEAKRRAQPQIDHAGLHAAAEARRAEIRRGGTTRAGVAQHARRAGDALVDGAAAPRLGLAHHEEGGAEACRLRRHHGRRRLELRGRPTRLGATSPPPRRTPAPAADARSR